MKNLRILSISFAFVYLSTALLCMLFQQPFLLGAPVYPFSAFVDLAVVLGFLVVCMLFINFPLLKWIKAKLFRKAKDRIYYLIGSLVVLQIATMLGGALESLSWRASTPDFFYYYRGITNSTIFLITGNATALIGSLLYTQNNKKRFDGAI